MSDPPYALIRLIRRRGSVEVYEARDASGSPIALRRIDRKAAAADPVAVERFRRERTIATTMRHPGIAACLGTGEDWLAFEWLESGLDDLELRRSYRRPAALRELLAALFETLAYLHARGVAHADLKPPHIRLREGRPVLIDFGVAALGAADPLARIELAGSPRWMAPERIAGASPSPACDVWSACAVAAWLCDGAPDAHGDADEILVARRRSPNAHHPWTGALAAADADLHELVASGLGPIETRPGAARLAQLISRSTAG